jgi:hypothetical protein
MKKQKINLLTMALLAGLAFAGHASANGSATISWTAPGDGDLAGFRIYYKNSAFTCANWNGLSQDERRADNAAGAGATVVIPDSGHPLGATATKYVFTDTARLTPGSTYYFAVVAYDNASPANLSDCSVGSGTAGASKAVTYPADITLGSCGSGHTHCIDGADYSLLHAAYAPGVVKAGNAADITADTYVDGADYSVLHAEYGLGF